ncbi:hypothetical protein MCAP1_003519 [Malassezia caprae]|uniref:Uncharacterized protein n=1 Tax=Malassezia caprae TaxID=1381934 RepID=A0AAF0EBE4_9BASI|nr:hypothetical protein MCAP1_003519 [Malassezia caprae]
MRPEDDPIFSSYILGTVADWQELVWKQHLHPVYIPVAVLSLAHAVRISHATRMLSGAARAQLGLFQSLVLNMIVLFGSSTLLGTHAPLTPAMLLGLPAPILLSPLAIVVYSIVHLVLEGTGLGLALVRLHTSASMGLVVDVVLAAIDAVCRSEAIANMCLTQIRRHPNPLVAKSLFVQLIAGALISGGVPLIAATFQLHSPQGHWQLLTPPWLRNASLLMYADLWGGALVAVVMTLLTSGDVEARFPWLPRPAPRLALWLQAVRKLDLHSVKNVPYLPLREAKAVGAVVLFVCLLVPVGVRRLRRPQRVPRRPAKKARKTK